MEEQAVEVRMGQTHLGFVDAAKGLGMLAIIPKAPETQTISVLNSGGKSTTRC